MLFLATFPINYIFFPKPSYRSNLHCGPSMNMADRPSKPRYNGNFFLESRTAYLVSIFSQNEGKTSFSSDPTPKNFISRSVLFQSILLPKSLSRMSLHLTTFLVRNFLPGPHQPNRNRRRFSGDSSLYFLLSLLEL